MKIILEEYVKFLNVYLAKSWRNKTFQPCIGTNRVKYYSVIGFSISKSYNTNRDTDHGVLDRPFKVGWGECSGRGAALGLYFSLWKAYCVLTALTSILPLSEYDSPSEGRKNFQPCPFFLFCVV